MTNTTIPSSAKRAKPKLREALELLDNYVRSSSIAQQYQFDWTADIVRDAIFRAYMRRAKRTLTVHKNQMRLLRMQDR